MSIDPMDHDDICELSDLSPEELVEQEAEEHARALEQSLREEVGNPL